MSGRWACMLCVATALRSRSGCPRESRRPLREPSWMRRSPDCNKSISRITDHSRDGNCLAVTGSSWFCGHAQPPSAQSPYFRHTFCCGGRYVCPDARCSRVSLVVELATSSPSLKSAACIRLASLRHRHEWVGEIRAGSKRARMSLLVAPPISACASEFWL